jgi:hypothetical protein
MHSFIHASPLEAGAVGLVIVVICLYGWDWCKKKIEEHQPTKKRIAQFGPQMMMMAFGVAVISFAISYGSSLPPTNYTERHDAVKSQIDQLTVWVSHESREKLFVTDDEKIEIANELHVKLIAAVEEHNQLLKDYEGADPTVNEHYRQLLFALMWVFGIGGAAFGIFGFISGLAALDD